MNNTEEGGFFGFSKREGTAIFVLALVAILATLVSYVLRDRDRTEQMNSPGYLTAEKCGAMCNGRVFTYLPDDQECICSDNTH